MAEAPLQPEALTAAGESGGVHPRHPRPGGGVVVREAEIGSILTRTSGYLKTVTSHSLQPYRGCTFGRSLCGVGCYVQHNAWLTRGEAWGNFLDVRVNAAQRYREQHAREQAWARKRRGGFGIFLSSSTDPFVPQERTYRVTRSVLEAMCHRPPDRLIVQTHSHAVVEERPRLLRLARRCDLRVHISVESDIDRLPGLPPPASPVERRLAAAAELTAAGLQVVITVAPLLPLQDPDRFFRRIAQAASGVVLDHYIGGDGTQTGSRTRRTALPAAIEAVQPAALDLDYRDRMAAVARRHLPGRVGVGIDGFAGRLT